MARSAWASMDGRVWNAIVSPGTVASTAARKSSTATPGFRSTKAP